jgi:hypothetical protein
MNRDAFQAWLLGFVTACGENPPTKEQWQTLLDAVKTLHKKESKVYPPTWTYTGTYASNDDKELLND